MSEDPDERTEMSEQESDDLVERETDAAAAEAGAIGGRRPDDEPDTADRPVSEGGGGEAEGFELAEQALRNHAEHRDAGGNPRYDASNVDEQADGSVHGEADHVESAERPDDDR